MISEEAYQQEIALLKQQIDILKGEKADLEEMLDTSSMHADLIQSSLQQSEARVKALLNVVPDLIWRIDRDGVILELVKAPKDPALQGQRSVFDVFLHGQRSAFDISLVGQNIGDAFPEETGALALFHIQYALERQSIQIYEYPYTIGEATAYLENRIVPFGEEQVIVFVRDVTDRIRFEQELHEAKEAALSASAAKSAFLANMSHELRTPLNAVLGFSQLLARSPNLDEEQKGFLGAIERGGQHLLELINDVLTLSKIESGRVELNPHSFHLGRLLALIEEMMQVRAKAKGLFLRFEIDANTPLLIHTDEGKLKQVIINLLSNAIKFTKAGGVTLWVRSVEGDRLEFAVEDTGVGIPQEELDQLFEAFVQTSSGKKSQEGTGLGLAISQQFVHLMKGKFQVRSTEGVGTTFTFTIHYRQALPEEVPDPIPKKRVVGLAPDQPQYRILVVEDRIDNQLLLTHLLTSVGFQVRTAFDGKEGIALWQEWSPHLIWMDMRMPVLDGFATTRYIKSAPGGQKTKIIALSSSVFVEEQTKILESGCDDFASKPIVEEVIFRKLSEHLGVKYLYEDENDNPVPLTQAVEITPTFLQVMPSAWIKQLHRAAVALKKKQVFKLIEEIPEEHRSLKQQLLQIAQNYQFDTLAEISEVSS